MRIRTQLLVAFLLLAVLPLVGIVGFSYLSSRSAMGRAAAAEAAELSADMEDRMGLAREGLQARMLAVPWTTVIDSGSPQQLSERIEQELGDFAPMLEALTFVPSQPAPPQPALPPELVLPGVELEDLGDLGDLGELSELAGLAVLSGLEVLEHLQEVEEVESEEGQQVPVPVPVPAPAPAPAPPVVWAPPGTTDRPEASGELNFVVPDAPPGSSSVRVFMLEQEGENGELVERFYELPGSDFPGSDLPGSELPHEIRLRALVGQEDGIGMPSAIDADPSEEGGATFRSWQQAWEQNQEAAQREFEAEFERSFREFEEQQTRLVFGQDQLEIRRDGEIVGALKPRINPERLLARVFRGTLDPGNDRSGEIPFAVDSAGRLYTSRPEDRGQLDWLQLEGREAGESWRQDDWVVAISADDPTGLRLGVARPIGEAMRELRASAVRNLVFGLALIALAVLGILPVSSRLSRGVQQVAAGAERIARGDLEVRLPVKGSGELAHLSRAFNSMAHDVRDHQERLLAEERRRLDQAVESELMQAELDRQRRELDEARAFQLSMLPRALPEHDLWEAAVFIETATEVGGDYYDFRLAGDGPLTVVVGDATGHGARAGTMVTVVKSLFSAHSTRESTPKEFLSSAGRTVRRMQLGRMAMALSILRLEERHVVLSNAGMPPVLHYRSDQAMVDEVLVPGMPLGGLASNYNEIRFAVEPGDSLLLYSDGLPEQPDESGAPFGYERVREQFAQIASGSPESIVEALTALVRELTGGEAPQDDVTLLVLRRRPDALPGEGAERPGPVADGPEGEP